MLGLYFNFLSIYPVTLTTGGIGVSLRISNDCRTSILFSEKKTVTHRGDFFIERIFMLTSSFGQLQQICTLDLEN